MGSSIPLRLDAEFDARVFTFALVVAVATGIGIGVWPAWRASRADARAALHDGGRAHSDSRDRQRLRRLFVVAQIAGSLVLLVVASLFVRSLWSAERIDLGFDANRLITVRLDPKQIGYDEARTITFYDELQRRAAALPGVESAAIAFTTPMSYLVNGGQVYVEGQSLPESGQPPALFMNRVGRNYFPTVGIPIVRGRGFVETDEHYTPLTRRVAIVNELMAAKYWPGEDPIGKRFRAFDPAGPFLEVVGVARDSKYVLIFEQPRPYFYMPLERAISLRTLHVRTFGPPAALAPLIEKEIKDLAPGLPMAELQTMQQSLAGLFGFLIFRVGSVQAGGMGILGLVLALIGVYGVVSFGASLRTREIGIRVALGAQPRDVLKLILGQGLQLVGAGIVLGLGIAICDQPHAGRIPLVNGADWGLRGRDSALVNGADDGRVRGGGRSSRQARCARVVVVLRRSGTESSGARACRLLRWPWELTMTNEKTDPTDPVSEDLKDADLDKVNGGLGGDDPGWVKSPTKADADKPLSGTDLGSGRLK